MEEVGRGQQVIEGAQPPAWRGRDKEGRAQVVVGRTWEEVGRM